MLIKNLPAFVYDIEVFVNYFSVTIKNTESGNHATYEISNRRNDMPKIARLFLWKDIYFVGYNSLHYDKPIISYILINYKRLITKPVWVITMELKQFSDLIINSTTSASWSKYKYANLYNDLDLLAMKWSKKLRPSLKALQVTMNYKNVEEYDGDFDAPLPESDIDKENAYNLNDVESTEEFLTRCKKDIDLRIAIEEEYGIDVMNKDGVNLGMEILKDRYLKETGLTWNQIKDLRSPCDNLCFGEIIFPYIEFKTPELKQLLDDLKQHCADPNDNSFERKFFLNGVEHTFGMGGLHSVNVPEIFKADDDIAIFDDDVASLYPSIIIQNNIFPQHLGEAFVRIYKNIRDERIEAKRSGNKLKNETLKLAINGLTGNLQSEFSWVYDPKAVLRIRINGQLLLLMYAESIALAGGKIVQSNTDGLCYTINKSLIPKVNEVKDWWEKLTGLELEREEFERFYQYAINDYIGVKKGWSESKNPNLIKKKGMFIDEPQLGKGLAPLIIPEALNKYFVEDIDPEITIKSCNDILKFCTFQKVAKDFHVEYGGQEVRHINRYYMSTNGKRLMKYKLNGDVRERITNLCSDSAVTLYNTFDNKDISERHINYQYYIHEVYKIIDKLNCQQLSLWN